MGYLSNVILAVVVPEMEAKRVAALYAQHPHVQEFKLAGQWSLYTTTCNGIPAVVFEFSEEYVRWYPSHEDVQGFEYMLELIQMLDDESEEGFPAATCFIRVGEEETDIECTYHAHAPDDASDFALHAESLLMETYYVRTEISTERPWDMESIESL